MAQGNYQNRANGELAAEKDPENPRPKPKHCKKPSRHARFVIDPHEGSLSHQGESVRVEGKAEKETLPDANMGRSGMAMNGNPRLQTIKEGELPGPFDLVHRGIFDSK
jgi:hypothetical protein